LKRNKADLKNERQVSTNEGMDLAKKCGVPFFEMSAKMNINVFESYIKLVWEIIHNHNEWPLDNTHKPPKRRNTCSIM
jgi:hypothetical protein